MARRPNLVEAMAALGAARVVALSSGESTCMLPVVLRYVNASYPEPPHAVFFTFWVVFILLL